MSSNGKIDIEIVQTTARLTEIGPAWTDLWLKEDGSIFQSHAWITAWWSTAPEREKRRLNIAVCWRDGEIRAVMALAIIRRRGLRVMEWAGKDHSDYCDALVAHDVDRSLMLGQVWDQITRHGGFDLVYLSHVLPDAAIRSLLKNKSSKMVRLSGERRQEASLRITGAWNNGDAWFQSLTSKMRQNNNRRRRLLSKEGDVVIRQWERHEPLAPLVDRLAHFKRQWVISHKLQSALFNDDNAALQAFVKVLADAGLLRLFVLECGGVIVAGSINFVQYNKMMVYLPSYDQAYERASPGVILMLDYITSSFDNGIKEIDFLCGNEEYKQKLASTKVELHSFMSTRTPIGVAAVAFDKCASFLRVALRKSPALRL